MTLFFADHWWETVAMLVLIYTMTISLIVYELTNYSALICEGHLSLSNSFVIYELSFINVSIRIVKDSLSRFSIAFEVSFVEFMIKILRNTVRRGIQSYQYLYFAILDIAC